VASNKVNNPFACFLKYILAKFGGFFILDFAVCDNRQVNWAN